MPGTNEVYVQGVEVTQAIQYYRSHMHLTDPLDQAPDNSVRLVANKPAWVRVYVRSGSSESVNNVTGSLRVERYNPQSFLAELNPQPPGTVTAFPDPAAGVPFATPYIVYLWERSNLAATLNFVIPSDLMCGYLRLTTRVSAPDGQTHEMLTLLNVYLRQEIHFRAIMIGYKGKDPLDPTGAKQVTVNPPTLADLQATSPVTLRMYPVSATAAYQSAGTLTLTTPLGPSGCDGDLGWNILQKLLDAAATADGNKPGCVYYGLIAPNVPGISPTLPRGGGGCNWGTVAAGYVESPEQVGADRVMAHEIGHFFQGHAPCGNPGGVDLNYPVYEPYDSASIGEYGLNVSTGEVMPPEIYKDIMSYCPPQVWMSLYGHKKRINQLLLNPEYVCVPKIEVYYPPKIPIDVTFPFVPARPRPIISIVGIQDLMGQLTIENVFRTLSYGQTYGVPTSLVAVLEGADGQQLASAPMFRVSGSQMGGSVCGCCDGAGGRPFLVKALLPDVGTGTALRVLRDGEEIWRRSAPPAPPRVTDISAKIVEQNRLALRWRAAGPQLDHLQYWVRWSGDRGETWNGLGTGITETEAAFALEGLPAGRIQLQVVAHDGFFSAPSKSVTVTVPTQPPIMSILHPREGATVAAGSTLHLWGAATICGGECEPDDFRWLVNGREVGRGLETWTVAPDAGEHRCTLRLEGDRERLHRKVVFKTAATAGPCRGPWSL